LAKALAKPEIADLKTHARAASPEEAEQVIARYREQVGAALKAAMRDALKAVLVKIDELNSGVDHLRELNNALALKPLTLRDFYATLLLAVHAPLEIGNKAYSFVMGCGCGDGMIAVINSSADPDKSCTLLMKPDSGEFSGEVDFLTEKALTEESLQGRIYPGLFGGLKALILMTDGVADDYFPNNPGIACLYADLILNRVFAPPPAPGDEELVRALQALGGKTLDEFKQLKINVPVYRVLESGIRPVEVASLAAFAQQLGVEKEKLALNQTLLAAACKHLPNPVADLTKPDDRLVYWLDSYNVRGSFDDRTILALTAGVKA
jgi:hypothetical protein